MIKLWASEILRVAPVPPATLKDAALSDVASAWDTGLFTEARPMLVQSLLRHAMAEAISEGFINCLIVTSLADANKELTRTHERLFARKCIVMLISYSDPFSCSLDVYSFPISYHLSYCRVLIEFIFNLYPSLFV